jgi:hypothetical protein
MKTLHLIQTLIVCQDLGTNFMPVPHMFKFCYELLANWRLQTKRNTKLKKKRRKKKRPYVFPAQCNLADWRSRLVEVWPQPPISSLTSQFGNSPIESTYRASFDSFRHGKSEIFFRHPKCDWSITAYTQRTETLTAEIMKTFLFLVSHILRRI